MIGETSLKKILTKRNIDVFIIAIAVFVGAYFDWKIIGIVIFVIFIWTILNPIPSRYLALPVLPLLFLTPFFIIFKKPELAERSSIYAYYFLIMTVMMGIYELRKEGKQEKN